MNAEAGKVLGVAQPPVSNNQPVDFENIQFLNNQLKGYNMEINYLDNVQSKWMYFK